jgi:hypothetical protein
MIPRNRRPLLVLFLVLACLGTSSLGLLHYWHARTVTPKSATTKKSKEKFPEAAPHPTAEQDAITCRELTELAAGKRVRLAWVESVDWKNPDHFTRGKYLRLAGFDSKDGYVRFTPETGTYSRPIITPDGQSIVYTMNPTSPKGGRVNWSPTMHLRSWDGKIQQDLGDGYALDAIQDPITKEMYIYALSGLSSHTQLALDGDEVVRFPLSHPSNREVVWSQTRITTDNMQVSRNGQYFGAQFPWPDAGWGNLATGGHHILAKGCWTSFAPDNSYLFWLYQGSHKILKMFDPVAKTSWSVSVADTAGFKNQPTYHPRWSNHPRFLTLSGPYPPEKKTKAAKSTKQEKQKRGVVAEIYLGRFSAKMDAVERWVRVTMDTVDDVYPDAWIEGGETAVLSAFAQEGKLEIPKRNTDDWPTVQAGLVYEWENSAAANEIPGRHGSCRAIGRGIGRFNRSYGMLLDGGSFETEAATTEALAKTSPTSDGRSLEFLYAESGRLPVGSKVRIVAVTNAEGRPYLEIFRQPEGFHFVTSAGVLAPEVVELPVTLKDNDLPFHLILNISSHRIAWFLHGNEVAALPLSDKLAWDKVVQCKLVFGEAKPVPAGWQGQLQNVACFTRTLTAGEIRSLAQASKPTVAPPAQRVRLRAKLTDATEPDMEDLASYTRMLIDHTYEVLEVLEGQFSAKKIVVLHWAVLDRQPVPGMPREVDQTFELTVEPIEQHPEVESELQISGSDDLEAPVYLDVATPTAPVVKQ